MKSKLAYWCDGALEASWLLAIILVPVYFNIHSDRVFEPDKLTLLRSLALLMAAVWLVRFAEPLFSGNRPADYFAWLRWRGEASIWQMPFVTAVAGIVVVYLLSTLFSVTPRTSWAGSYQRLQGTYTTLAYVVVFAVMAATIRERSQVQRLITAVIVTSVAVALYAMLQHFDADPLPWGGDTVRRVAGHMGNSIFIGAYLIMAMPLTLSRIIHAFANILRDEDLSYADVVRSSVYIFALAIQLIALYWTQSRGPLLGIAIAMYAFVLILLVALRNAAPERGRLMLRELGLAIGLVLAGLVGYFVVLDLLINALTNSGRAQSLAGAMSSLVSFLGAVGALVVTIFVILAARRGWRWLWISWITLAIILAGWLVLFNLSGELVEESGDSPLLGPVITSLSEWRDLPAVGRFGRLLDADRGSGRVRVLIWEGVIEMLSYSQPLTFPDGGSDPFHFLRPLLGYGPESMYVAYNNFYQPELATIEARNATPDRSHNETFDALVITGGLGFLFWQALYLSVFLFGFRWLGVIRDRRDRNLFLGLAIAGAVILGAVFAVWRGPTYLGVAVPFGGIAGVVLYLIYYALVARHEEDSLVADPFKADRLLLIGLLAAMLGHYVEIHFGIAIAATRLHFFVYLAVMFLVGYLLPERGLTEAIEVKSETTPEPEDNSRRGRRGSRRRRPAIARGTGSPGWIGPVIAIGLLLGVLVGTMGYEFMTYATRPGESFNTIADVPTAAEIFYRSLFIDPDKNFAESPFLFLMMMFTWLLAVLAFVSEMTRDGTLSLPSTLHRLKPRDAQLAAIPFVLLLVVSVAARFMGGRELALSPLQTLGQGFLVLWGAMCLLAVIYLFLGRDIARLIAGVIGLIGFLFAIPVSVAGAPLYGLILATGCGAALYLVWDNQWNDFLAPAGIIGLLSLMVGLAFTYYQAYQIRLSIIGPVVTAETPDTVRRVMEADQRAGFVTIFYIFVILALLVMATMIARPRMARAKLSGPTASLAQLGVSLVVVFILMGVTNLSVVQADIIYKWARPWDQQAVASRSNGDIAGSLGLWDQAIAIYEHAIEEAPIEDFYYLFLGRAYLEKSATTTDTAESERLLATAEDRLLEAQRINPLNTDHTANLARLHSRWAQTSPGSADFELHVDTAERYYQSALDLSPNNSVIWNEYAQLYLGLRGDCAGALAIFAQSLEVDPFYEDTYIRTADTYATCADELDDEAARDEYYIDAIENYRGALDQLAARNR
ncbi:MAG: hypothetical protein KDE04_09880, partial [Anaerolineales bacterium]|nr:hypothetical protein [Anaerolineales bacterium]